MHLRPTLATLATRATDGNRELGDERVRLPTRLFANRRREARGKHLVKCRSVVIVATRAIGLGRPRKFEVVDPRVASGRAGIHHPLQERLHLRISVRSVN